MYKHSGAPTPTVCKKTPSRAPRTCGREHVLLRLQFVVAFIYIGGTRLNDPMGLEKKKEPIRLARNWAYTG